MGFFANSVETREQHKNENLRTRYYKNNFEQVKNCLEKICKEEDMQLQQVNKKFGDIYICAYDFEIFATVIEITPIETSVDLKINYFATFGFGKPEKKAIHIYERLNKMLIFKGTMLHLK